jgi:hypothetical protein
VPVIKHAACRQGICMYAYGTKNLNLGVFLRAFESKMLIHLYQGIGIHIYRHLVYFMANRYILCPFCILYGHFVYFVVIWYILWPFCIFYGHFVYFIGILYILWPLVYFTTIGIFYHHLVYLPPFV